MLWISGDDAKPMVEKLTAAKLNLEWQPASSGANAVALFQWLAQHKREAFPLSIDCETNSPTFARCYWIQPTKFDANERNDVLPSTRIPGGTGAVLDLGGFAFKKDDPGPGVLVTSLPEKYSGPLKAGDRLIALDGKPLADARQYLEMMEKVTDEKPAVVTVQRGKDRIRVETRIVLPRRDTGVTSRVQGAISSRRQRDSDCQPHHHRDARNGAARVGARHAPVERADVGESQGGRLLGALRGKGTVASGEMQMTSDAPGRAAINTSRITTKNGACRTTTTRRSSNS